MSNVSKERVLEIIGYYLLNGEKKTLLAYSFKQDTLRKYLDIGKAEYNFIDIKKSKILRDVGEKFSTQELQAIVKGARILPGQSSVPFVSFKGETTKIGLMGDIHFGSKYCLYPLVNKAFKEFEKEKVDIVCQVGDLTEGMSNRAGHVYELSHIGFHEQKKVAIKYMARCPAPLYMIDGNHDRWFIKSNGAIIVQDICDAIEHATFLGHDEGDLALGPNATVRLWHGEDGSSYAVSYRIQKIVESLTGGTKPNVMFLGHVHKSMYLYDRHIHCYSAGAFQRQTAWMRGKRLSSHTGFWIIEITVGDNGVNKTTGTWYPFYA